MPKRRKKQSAQRATVGRELTRSITRSIPLRKKRSRPKTAIAETRNALRSYLAPAEQYVGPPQVVASPAPAVVERVAQRSPGKPPFDPFKSRSLYQLSKQNKICKTRTERREVLFAASGGGKIKVKSRHFQRNENSKVRC